MGSGIVDFEDYFQGDDDTAKVKSMNAMYRAHGGKQTPTTRFPARQVTTSTPIEYWSGLSLIGGAGLPVREFSRRPTIRYTGAPGTALFKFPGAQTNQSYPASGAPRDISIKGIQFTGTGSVDCVERVDTYTAAKVLWYCQFDDCGWNGFRTVWVGFVNGGGIGGLSHFQAFTEQAIFWRGSEATLCGLDRFSFMDTNSQPAPPAGTARAPQIRWAVSKGELGRVMPTTRKDGLALLIDSGGGLRVHGFSPDSQSSDPCYGANIRIEGNASDVLITDSTFKGGMSNPTAGNGGAAKNKAIIHIEQGGDHIIDHNVFRREGSNPGPVTTPLVYAGPNVPAGGIRVGLNAHSGYTGILLQSKPGQIINLDPTLQVVTA